MAGDSSPDYALVPVDHQPDFSNASLVPVDHDPFAEEGVVRQARAAPVQPPINGAEGGAQSSPDQTGNESQSFSGYANPSLAESLVNQQKMKDQEDIINADRTIRTNGDIVDGGEKYKFVTTAPSRRSLTMDHTGSVIVATSPFYAFDGQRYAFIDASPAQPMNITVNGDGTFTIGKP